MNDTEVKSSGEDVERVARAIEGHPVYGNLFSGDPRALADLASFAVAALSARPVEAQEVERLRADLRATETAGHDLATGLAAAIARAEAAEAVIEKVRAVEENLTDLLGHGAELRSDVRGVRNTLRRVLLGDSEGRESPGAWLSTRDTGEGRES